MKNQNINIVKDETRVMTEEEKQINDIITVNVQCKLGDLNETRKSKSIVCITIDENEVQTETIITGAFSLKNMLAYIQSLNTVKSQFIQKVSDEFAKHLVSELGNVHGEDKKDVD